MTDEEKTRRKIERHKECIRNGDMTKGDRQDGKTTALMEVMHEDFGEKGELAYVAVKNMRMAEMFIDNYRKRWPNDTQPEVFPAQRAEHHLRGVDAKGRLFADTVHVDDLDKMSILIVLNGIRGFIWYETKGE